MLQSPRGVAPGSLGNGKVLRAVLSAAFFILCGILIGGLLLDQLRWDATHLVLLVPAGNDTGVTPHNAGKGGNRTVARFSPLTRADLQTPPVEPAQLLMPLGPIHQAHLAGNGTVFVLRIMKTASTFLQYLFSTKNPNGECEPHLNVLRKPADGGCNRLYTLLSSGVLNEGCKDLTGWDEPAFQELDCIPFVGSWVYEESYYSLPPPERARVSQAFEHARIISGHYSFGLHRIGHRGSYAYVTSVRNPIDRVISWFNNDAERTNFEGNLTFDKWLEEDAPAGYQKDNHHVRVLCNEGTRLRYDVGAQDPLPWPVTVEHLNDVTEAHFHCALAHLWKNFALVFQTERIDEVYELGPVVSHLFNMKVVADLEPEKTYNPGTYEGVDKRVKFEELTEEVQQKLAEYNKWDMLLYQEAHKLHDLSIARLREFKLQDMGEPAVMAE